jgi:hypothetical protein
MVAQRTRMQVLSELTSPRMSLLRDIYYANADTLNAKFKLQYTPKMDILKRRL